MSETITIQEAYGRSTVADDLSHKHGRGATDFLAAVAWSDVEFGSTLMRVLTINDAWSYKQLQGALNVTVARRALVKRWEVGGVPIGEQQVSCRHCMTSEPGPVYVARVALHHFVFDVCPVCCGRKYKPLDSHPNVLSDDLCPSCDGSGKPPVFTKDKRWKPFVLDIIELLHERYVLAGTHAMNRLVRSFDGPTDG